MDEPVAPKTNPVEVPSKTGWALLVSDVQRLGRLGAKVGAVLAVLCHMLPPHFRPICDALASACTGGR